MLNSLTVSLNNNFYGVKVYILYFYVGNMIRTYVGSGASAVAVRLVDGAERVVACLDNIIVFEEQWKLQ